jgi:hypothetical protein
MERMNALALWALFGFAMFAALQLVGAVRWIATECPSGLWGC